jgi:aspartyl-tRNA(Asn)/glutamyl-tRNA(Gln) amidotransferase subunit A
MDHAGPIARSVDDLAILLEAIAARPIRSAPRSDPPRLGRLRGLFADRAEPASLMVFENALEQLARFGAAVREIDLPKAFNDVLDCHRVIITFEAAGHHRQLFADHAARYLPCIRGLIEEGLQVPVDRYNRCREHKAVLLREIATTMHDVDALVCPATVGPAPSVESTGDPSFNAPWSYTGQPTISFSVGLSPEGMPLSIQLIGRAGDESTLFGVAQWCECRLAS